MAPPPHTTKGDTANGGAGGGATHSHTKPKPKPNRTTAKPPTVRPTTHSTAPKPVPPKLGYATLPQGATYDVADDGQTFTMVHSTLEADIDLGRLSKSLSTTVPVTGDTGDAAIVLAASGYVFTDASTTAKLTITANGRTSTRVFEAGSDRSYVQSFTVPLRGAHQCRITIKIELSPNPLVREPAGVMDVLALDARFR